MNLFAKISNYFIPDNIGEAKVDSWKAVCFVNIVLFILFVTILSYSLCTIFSVPSEFNHFTLIALSSAALLIFKLTDSFTLACNIIAAILFFLFAKDILIHGKLYSFGNAYLAAIPFLIYIFTKNWMGHIWTGVICTYIFWLYKLEKDDPISTAVLTENFDPDFQIIVVNLFFVFLLGLAFIVSKSQGIIINELNEKKIILENQKETLEHQKEKLEQLKAELIRSNQELEIYAQAASHDLKQPIRTINSFGKLLEKEMNGSLTTRAKEYLGFIIDGSLDMNDMVSEMLNYSKINSWKNIKFEVINPREIISDLQLKLKAQIDAKNAKIIIHELPEKILGQRTKISQLFQNLISNAIKFQQKDQPLIIEISGIEKQNHWHFLVQDNGIGIDELYHEKIFELFSKLHSKNTYSGSGIGLATCKKIAQMHQGDIWVNSVAEGGASFQFTISKNLSNPN